jgi:hypothetical protein
MSDPFGKRTGRRPWRGRLHDDLVDQSDHARNVQDQMHGELFFVEGRKKPSQGHFSAAGLDVEQPQGVTVLPAEKRPDPPRQIKIGGSWQKNIDSGSSSNSSFGKHLHLSIFVV